MALLTLTSRYSNLDTWPGRLFEADDATVVTTRTASSFAFSYGVGHDFAGYTVSVAGTGFKYLDGVAIDGDIATIVIRNALNQVVLTLSGFAAGTLAGDLSQFAANVFGSPFDEAGPGPDGKLAWTHLLSGSDVVNGTAGDDWRILPGLNAGNEVFRMFGGDDRIGGSVGNDTMHGGSGWDEVTFRETSYNDGATALRGITVNMNTQKILDCWGGTDIFTGIEAVEGSRFNDVFIGSAGRDEFSGLRGADVFNGGADRDRIRYDNDYWQGGQFGIVVDLETAFVDGKVRGTVRDGFGTRDTTIDIERVTGTRFDDSFTGSRAANKFSGGEGRDSYKGEGGFDTVNFSRWFADAAPTGIVVNLKLASGQIQNDGFGNVENAVSIEGIEGSDANDRITMRATASWVVGLDGADTMTGGGGADDFEWWDQTHFGDGDVITDFVASGAASEVDQLSFDTAAFEGMTTTLRLVNGANATIAAGQFIYNAADDTLYWDRDGTGGAAKVAVVQLTGVSALSAANFDLY